MNFGGLASLLSEIPIYFIIAPKQTENERKNDRIRTPHTPIPSHMDKDTPPIMVTNPMPVPNKQFQQSQQPMAWLPTNYNIDNRLFNAYITRSHCIKSYYSPEMLKILDYSNSASRSRTRLRTHSASSAKAESIVSYDSHRSRSPSPSFSPSLSPSNNPSDFTSNSNSNSNSNLSYLSNLFAQSQHSSQNNNNNIHNNIHNNNNNNSEGGSNIEFDLRNLSLSDIEGSLESDYDSIYSWPGDYGLGGNDNDLDDNDNDDLVYIINNDGIKHIRDWLIIDERNQTVNVTNNLNIDNNHLKLNKNDWKLLFETIAKNKNKISKLEINGIIMDKESNRFFKSIGDAVINHGLDLEALTLLNVHFMDGKSYSSYLGNNDTPGALNDEDINDVSIDNNNNIQNIEINNNNEEFGEPGDNFDELQEPGQRRRKLKNNNNIIEPESPYMGGLPMQNIKSLNANKKIFNFESFVESLGQCKQLNTLVINQTNLNDLFNLTHNLNDNLNSNETHLMKLISHHTMLNNIILTNNNIKEGTLFVDALLKRVKSGKSQIKCLDLRDNPLSHSDIASIEWAASMDYSHGKQFPDFKVSQSFESGYNLLSKKKMQRKRNNNNNKKRNKNKNKNKNKIQSSFDFSSNNGHELQNTLISSILDDYYSNNGEFNDSLLSLFPTQRKALQKLKVNIINDAKNDIDNNNNINNFNNLNNLNNEHRVCQTFKFTRVSPPGTPPPNIESSIETPGAMENIGEKNIEMGYDYFGNQISKYGNDLALKWRI